MSEQNKSTAKQGSVRTLNKKEEYDRRIRNLTCRLESPNLDTKYIQKFTAEIQKIRNILNETDEAILLEESEISIPIDSDSESEPIFQGPDTSELLDNGIRLYTFWDQHSESLARKADVQSKQITIGKDVHGDYWSIVFRGQEENYAVEYLECIPSEFAGMRVLVRFSTTVEHVIYGEECNE